MSHSSRSSWGHERSVLAGYPVVKRKMKKMEMPLTELRKKAFKLELSKE